MSAAVPRALDMISPRSCRKIRYGSRSDTAAIRPDRQRLPTTASAPCIVFWNPTDIARRRRPVIALDREEERTMPRDTRSAV
jgi:hypothetical protein